MDHTSTPSLSFSCSCWPYKVERTHLSESKGDLSALIRFVGLCPPPDSVVQYHSCHLDALESMLSAHLYLLIFTLRSSHFGNCKNVTWTMWQRDSIPDRRDPSPAQAKSISVSYDLGDKYDLIYHCAKLVFDLICEILKFWQMFQ